MPRRLSNFGFADASSRCVDAIKLRTRRNRGIGLIELSLLMPTLLIIALGTAQFGQYFYIRNAFEAAARDVARASCLATAVQTDAATKATATLSQANVTFNSAWMTIIDCSNSNSTVTDVSAIPVGHTFQVTIQCQYNQIPNVFIPLSNMPGCGIGATKICLGQCAMIKD